MARAMISATRALILLHTRWVADSTPAPVSLNQEATEFPCDEGRASNGNVQLTCKGFELADHFAPFFVVRVQGLMDSICKTTFFATRLAQENDTIDFQAYEFPFEIRRRR